MEDISLVKAAALGPVEGVFTLIGLGLAMLGVSYYAKWKLVRNTHDFVIAGRQLGLGFGIAGLLSVWTWVIGILLPIGVTFQYGLSGLFWFTVPNGAAVIAVIPFAKKLRKLMPHGYTVSEFVSARYGGSKLARIVEEVGTYTVVAVSAIMPILIALTNDERFDYASLTQVQDISEAPKTREAPATTYGLEDQDEHSSTAQENDSLLFGAVSWVVGSALIIASYGWGWQFLFLGLIICLVGPIVSTIAINLDVKKYKKILAD